MDDATSTIFTQFYNDNKTIVIKTILAQFILSLCESIYIPIIVGTIIREINDTEKTRGNMIKLITTFIIIKMVYVLSNSFNTSLSADLYKWLVRDITNKIISKYYIDNEEQKVGEVVNRIYVVINTIQEIIMMLCTIFLPKSIVLIFNVLNIFRRSKELGSFLCVMISVQLVIVSRTLNSCDEMSLTSITKKDEVYDYIEEIILNLPNIRGMIDKTDKYTMIGSTLDEKLSLSYQSISANNDCIQKNQRYGMMVNTTMFCVFIYLLYSMYVKNTINNENMVTNILLTVGLFENINDVVYQMPNFLDKVTLMKSNDNFLKKLTIPSSSTINSRNLKLDNYDISVENMSFQYDTDPPTIILDNLNFKIEYGSTVCIKGPSGRGKSTLMKLLYGIIKPTSGQITIGGHNIDEFNSRQYICYICQNYTTMFKESILYNIILGDDDIKLQDVINLIEKYDLLMIFENLIKDDKYGFLSDKSVVGKLSGGQIQIIYLLKMVFNKTCKIVLLDESMSAIDSVVVNKIKQLIKDLKKTFIIITHDNSFDDICNQLIQM